MVEQSLDSESYINLSKKYIFEVQFAILYNLVHMVNFLEWFRSKIDPFDIYSICMGRDYVKGC